MDKRVLISEIVIGKRHRQDMGDIQTLADSIEKQGLLQPIGITSEKQLVFGARRIEAFKLLGRDEIPARVVDVTSLVEGEHDENELRKQFTMIERVAIAAAIEETIGNRQGHRMDLDTKQLPVPVPEVVLGRETRDISAKKAGFGSGRTYQQARAVIEHGTPELQEAMDKKEVSVKDAETLSRLPPHEQREALKLPKSERVAKAKSLRTANPLKQNPPPARTRESIEAMLPSPPPETGLGDVYTDAFRFAGIALAQLGQIVMDDPFRKQALIKVRDWINAQLGEETENAGPSNGNRQLRVV